MNVSVTIYIYIYKPMVQLQLMVTIYIYIVVLVLLQLASFIYNQMVIRRIKRKTVGTKKQTSMYIVHI